MAVGDNLRSMYIHNFQSYYVCRLTVISARCCLKRDPFAYESRADVHRAT